MVGQGVISAVALLSLAATLTAPGAAGWRAIDREYVTAAASHAPASPSVYKNPAMVERVLADYHARYPELTRLESLGTSHEGRPIWALKISDHAGASEAEPAILLDGAHHGNELITTEHVLDAVRTLLDGYDHDPRMRRLVDELEIWCVPLVNPDGRAAYLDRSRGAGRKNVSDTDGDGTVLASEGVDLNRNYPLAWGQSGERGSRSHPHHRRYRGPSAASEPESRAMMALAARERFVAAISYHTAGTVIMPPYAASGLTPPQDDEAWPVAEAVAATTPIQPNGKRYRLRPRLYTVDGVWKDWLRHSWGTVALVVEGPLHNPKSPEQRDAAIASTRATWLGLMERFVTGPALSGTVRDETGLPLEARVRIVEIRERAGERWTSRPQDGTYARYLPGPGSYTIEASAPGYRTLSVGITVDCWAGIELILERDDTIGAVALLPEWVPPPPVATAPRTMASLPDAH